MIMGNKENPRIKNGRKSDKLEETEEKDTE